MNLINAIELITFHVFPGGGELEGSHRVSVVEVATLNAHIHLGRSVRLRNTPIEKMWANKYRKQGSGSDVSKF